MSWNFHVGQRVVCIDPDNDPDEPNPQYGEIYTISAVFMYAQLLCINLVELPNHGSAGRYGPGYVATSFRPIVTRKTDISIFTDMLKTKKVTA